MLKAQPKYVAKSLTELAKKADAVLVLHSAEEEAKVQGKKINEKVKAYQALAEPTLEEKRDAVLLFGRSAASADEDAIDAVLGAVLEEDPKKFLALLKHPDINQLLFLKKLHKAGFITKKGRGYYFEDTLIGSDEESAVEYLKDKNNNDVVLTLKTFLAGTTPVATAKNKKTKEANND